MYFVRYSASKRQLCSFFLSSSPFSSPSLSLTLLLSPLDLPTYSLPLSFSESLSISYSISLGSSFHLPHSGKTFSTFICLAACLPVSVPLALAPI